MEQSKYLDKRGSLLTVIDRLGVVNRGYNILERSNFIDLDKFEWKSSQVKS